MQMSHVEDDDLTNVEVDLTDEDEDTNWPIEITQVVPRSRTE